MKKILVLILSLFLLTTVNCVTTKQDVAKTEEPEVAETGPADFDLSGTWIKTEATKAPTCGGNKKAEFTVEIAQKGNLVEFNNIDLDRKTSSNASGHILPIAGGDIGGNVTTSDYKLKVSADANTISGKVNWRYEAGGVECGGYTITTFKRK